MTIHISTRPVSHNSEYYGSITLSVQINQEAKSDHLLQIQIRPQVSHILTVQRKVTGVQPLLFQAVSCNYSGRNSSSLWVRWWSSWSAHHTCINSLCDFNFCVRTCLGFAALSPRHIPQSEYDIHPVTPFSLIQLSRTCRIYLFMSPWTISVEPVALILASALISHSPYRCILLCLSSSCGEKTYLVTKKRELLHDICVW